MFDRTNDDQAQKEYKYFLEYIHGERKKPDDPVMAGLFKLQDDRYNALYMPPP
jgi:hypothetical protein